jgi:hypothetical protein
MHAGNTRLFAAAPSSRNLVELLLQQHKQQKEKQTESKLSFQTIVRHTSEPYKGATWVGALAVEGETNGV